MKLKKKYMTLIEGDVALQGALASATGKSLQAPIYWVKNELHEKLTQLSVLQCVQKYTGAESVDELVEQPAAV